jgi:hypothetical protein
MFCRWRASHSPRLRPETGDRTVLVEEGANLGRRSEIDDLPGPPVSAITPKNLELEAVSSSVYCVTRPTKAGYTLVC